MQPVEHDGHHGEQRESGEDATDEGEAEPHGHRASARFGTPAQIGSYVGGQASERRRDGRAETGAGTQRVGERA